MEPFANPDDESIRRLLTSVRRIAVVGLSPRPHRASHRVGRFLLESGYDVVAVYPREEEILGCPVYRRVQDVPGPLDLVDVFRRRDDLPSVIDDVLAAGAAALWLQIGCIDEDGARRARDAGLTVVMNRCVMHEHARLLAGSATRS